jgi:hypothetical protein
MRSDFLGSNKTGCPTLAASLFLRLGWDSTTKNGSGYR